MIIHIGGWQRGTSLMPPQQGSPSPFIDTGLLRFWSILYNAPLSRFPSTVSNYKVIGKPEESLLQAPIYFSTIADTT
jgi:hypothetical protein